MAQFVRNSEGTPFARTSSDVIAADSQTSQFERLGGVAGITRLVARFYDKVLADPALSPYFADVALDKLRRMQFEFFSAALGAPVRYSGRSIMQAHSGRRITGEHFRAFVGHLDETLKEHALSDGERKAIIDRINAYADDVVKPVAALDP